jgi:WD40 repeat protein
MRVVFETGSFSADGKLLLSVFQGKMIRIRDAASMNVVQDGEITLGNARGCHPTDVVPVDEIIGVAMRNTDQLLIATRNTMGMWDRVAKCYRPIHLKISATSIKLVLSQDGSRLATISDLPSTELWDLASDDIDRPIPVRLPLNDVQVSDAKFSPDGAFLVTASADGVARVWKSRPLELIAEIPGHLDALGAVAVTDDGTRLATTSKDGSVRIWDLATRQQLSVLYVPASDNLLAAFWPDESHLSMISEGAVLTTWPLYGSYEKLLTAAEAYLQSLEDEAIECADPQASRSDASIRTALSARVCPPTPIECRAFELECQVE